MKVLLVENSTNLRGIIRSMLTKFGFDDVLEAEDGSQACSMLQSYKIDLVLTDWDMPVMDGIELVGNIRNDTTMDHIPVLMFSERSDKEEVMSAMEAGIDSYITKPFTPNQLKAKLQSLAGRRSKRQIFQVTKGAVKNLRTNDGLLVVLAETTVDPRRLDLPDNRETLSFLYRSAAGLNRLNSRREGPPIGYLLPTTSNDITGYMRLTHGHIKLMMISPDIPGGGITVARLVSINPRGGPKLFIVCDRVNDIPVKVRYGLERMDITILERHKLSAEALETLFDEYVAIDSVDDAKSELLSPEEISKRLENDIRHMVNLPVLPQVYHKIVGLDRDKSSEINDWVAAIESDPLTQAQVIRRARSPIYGFRGEINDTSKAVVLLGKNTVKELVTSSALRRSCENLADDSFKVEDYWLHSVAVGTMARLLSFPMDETLWTPDNRKSYEEFALDEETQKSMETQQLYKRFPLESHQDPFTGGMMHDIGKIAMVHAYPGLFSAITNVMEIQRWNRPMAIAEEAVTGGFNHCQVGRILGESWKLGSEICQVIEHHHTPSKDDAYARLIALADFLVAGLYRYPGQARYPMTHILEEEGSGNEEGQAETPPPTEEKEKDAEEGQAEAPQAAAADNEEAAEWAKIAAESPNDALVHFMPADLPEYLGMTPSEIIDLGHALTPVVRRLTERLQQSG